MPTRDAVCFGCQSSKSYLFNLKQRRCVDTGVLRIVRALLEAKSNIHATQFKKISIIYICRNCVRLAEKVRKFQDTLVSSIQEKTKTISGAGEYHVQSLRSEEEGDQENFENEEFQKDECQTDRQEMGDETPEFGVRRSQGSTSEVIPCGGPRMVTAPCNVTAPAPSLPDQASMDVSWQECVNEIAEPLLGDGPTQIDEPMACSIQGKYWNYE